MKKSQMRGFTLIEVMVVVTILAILAGIVVQRLLSRPDQAKIVRAKQDILTVENAMSLYKLDNGFYPSTSQGVKALTAKPASEPVPRNWPAGGYLKRVPTDPWNNPYRYENNGGQIKIFTYGADNKAGGTGGNAEISNMEEN